MLVDIDKVLSIDVINDDGFRRMIHKKAITGLALSHGLLGFATIRDVAQTEHEDFSARDLCLADSNLGRKKLAVLALSPRLTRGEIQRRVTGTGRHPIQRLRDRLVSCNLRYEQIDTL